MVPLHVRPSATGCPRAPRRGFRTTSVPGDIAGTSLPLAAAQHGGPGVLQPGSGQHHCTDMAEIKSIAPFLPPWSQLSCSEGEHSPCFRQGMGNSAVISGFASGFSSQFPSELNEASFIAIPLCERRNNGLFGFRRTARCNCASARTGCSGMNSAERTVNWIHR